MKWLVGNVGIGIGSFYVFKLLVRTLPALEAAEWRKVMRVIAGDVRWMLRALWLLTGGLAARLVLAFWYWLRARDILVSAGGLVVIGRVEARRGGSWTVRIRALNLSQAMFWKLHTENPDTVRTLMLGYVDVQIDQRGVEWAEPSGPEENAFRTIVALTENN